MYILVGTCPLSNYHSTFYLEKQISNQIVPQISKNNYNSTVSLSCSDKQGYFYSSGYTVPHTVAVPFSLTMLSF